MLFEKLKYFKIIFVTIIFCLLVNKNVYASQYKFSKIENLNNPWGMSFINNEELIVSEQGGKLILINLTNYKKVK